MDSANTRQLNRQAAAPRQPAKDGHAGLRTFITWTPLVALSILIFTLSAQPILGQSHLLEDFLSARFGANGWYFQIEPVIQYADQYVDETAHFMEYVLLALSALWAISRQWPAYGRAYRLAFAYTAIFALSDEVHQAFVPGRHSDPRDIATDWLGAAMALGLVHLLTKDSESASEGETDKLPIR